MKEFKGTKGKWGFETIDRLETNIISITHRIARVKHYSERVHEKLLEPTLEEGIANAKLIAAAPEMLDLLQNIKAINELHSFNGHLINEQINNLLNKILE